MMPAMRWLGGLIMAAASGWLAGACGSSVFACSSDEQCESGGVGGLCQPDGYCSFPDDSCPSGHRFGDAAPTGVANACVEPSGTGSSDTGPEPASSSDGIEPPDPDGTPEGSSTAALDDGPTTAPPPDDTTGEPPDPTTGGEDDTTTGEAEVCRTVFVDPFDEPMLSPMWSTFTQPGTELWVEEGQLAISIAPSPEWTVAGAVFDVDSLVGGWVRLHVTQGDDSGLPIAGGLAVTNEICQLQLFIDAGGIAAALWSNPMLTITGVGYIEDPGLPIWLQIRLAEDGEWYFEWSPDAITWNEVARGSFPECGDLLGLVTTGINTGGEFARGLGTRYYEQFELCLPP
jgi:hypothetical protein